MKLIDILARELKAWPEGCKAITQDSDGYVVSAKDVDVDSLHFDHNAWSGEGGTYMEIHELASDHKTAIVTRAEWQDAVDALKAAEVSYSAENVSVDTNYVTHTSSPINSDCKIVQPEWDGVGLPPAGTVCEFNSNWAHAAGGSTWHIVTVVFSSAESYVVRRNSAPEGETTELCGPATGYEISRFRPIRTPEQIAAEEKGRAMTDMLSIVTDRELRGRGVTAQLEAIYDAGYRKQVTK
jgi:hypothetical protein